MVIGDWQLRGCTSPLKTVSYNNRQLMTDDRSPVTKNQ